MMSFYYLCASIEIEMDRNTVIGFSLLAALLIGYVLLNQQGQKGVTKDKLIQDSIAAVKKAEQALNVPTLADTAAASRDSLRLQGQYGDLATFATGTEAVSVLQNEDVKLTLSNKGGYIKSVELKKYKNYDGGPLVMFDGDKNFISYSFTSNGRDIRTSDLFFQTTGVQKQADGTESIDFVIDMGNGKKIAQHYSLAPGKYLVDYNFDLNGIQSSNGVKMVWQAIALHTEKDIKNERVSNQVYYKMKDGSQDFFTVKTSSEKNLTEAVSWLSYKTHFFNATLIARNAPFNSAAMLTGYQETNNKEVSSNLVTLALPYNGESNFSYPMQMYLGPNHYQTLKKLDIDLENIIPLGSGVFAFVKYINKWLIIPVFNVLSKFMTNYGIIILILTLIIRLLTSFFTYKSYLSAAKMRVLKPEVDALKEKYGEDQQKIGMEQMKLFRSAGVNPLGGCIPALLQLPFLVAMYYFFPSSIELRQQSFLWAQDLSTYDSIVTWGFSIPFLGNHLSLFTILVTITSIVLAFYNRGMQGADNNPMMKYLPYIMPIMFLGIFNNMAAALTFYYFVSNVISILMQWVIQNFIINEDKIHARIKENLAKPVQASKWQQKMEEMQKQNGGRVNQPKK